MFKVVAATWLSFVVLQSHPVHPTFSISWDSNETADAPTQVSFPDNGCAWGVLASVIGFSHRFGLEFNACGRLKRWVVNGLLHAFDNLEKDCLPSRRTCLLGLVFLHAVSSREVLKN